MEECHGPYHPSPTRKKNERRQYTHKQGPPPQRQRLQFPPGEAASVSLQAQKARDYPRSTLSLERLTTREARQEPQGREGNFLLFMTLGPRLHTGRSQAS